MAATTQALVDTSVSLHAVVLDDLCQQILPGLTRDPRTGCLTHASPTGQINWCGGLFNVKRALYEHLHGVIARHLILTRTCTGLSACVAPEHHLAQSRADHGRWLGRGSTWRPQPE